MQQKSSIKTRLIVIILLVSSLTTLVGYGGFIYWFMSNQYKKSIELSHTIGLVLSQNITKLVFLNDISIATDISSSLHYFKTLNKMVIYDIDKKVIYQYSHDNKYFNAASLPDKLDSKMIKNDFLEVYIEAKYQDTFLGYIKFDMKIKSVWDVFVENLSIILFLWLMMFIVSYLLAIYYAREFTYPILRLVSFLEEIETVETLDETLTTKQNNEYGKLYKEINMMLKRIKLNHNALEQYKNNLENIVEEKIEENTKQLEVLQQQSKMAQMGEMIGAIAHQWRQPLNTISISIQNLKYDFDDGYLNDEDFIKEFIDKNKKTVKFMSQTIDDFRSFFRIDKDKKDFYVKETTQSVIAMQLVQLKDLDIALNISGDEFVCNGLQSEYQQVILNLINNAKDALIENNTEDPTIDITLGENRIYIQDNAGGILSDVINRVFEPYFSTKEQGKGTGMGLYISKMIIEDNMGGTLSVENRDGGARFCIEL